VSKCSLVVSISSLPEVFWLRSIKYLESQSSFNCTVDLTNY
jgi:hypothetical protein